MRDKSKKTTKKTVAELINTVITSGSPTVTGNTGTTTTTTTTTGTGHDGVNNSVGNMK